MCPYEEREQDNTQKGRLKKRIIAWDKLIGPDKDGVGAAKVIIKIFVSTDDDRKLVKGTLESCKQAGNISRGQLGYLLRAVNATAVT